MADPVETSEDIQSSGQATSSGQRTGPRDSFEAAGGKKKSGKSKPKTRLVQCRHCGERISSRARKCPACRTILAASDKLPVRSSDKEKIEPTKDLVDQKVQSAIEEALPSSPEVHTDSESNETGARTDDVPPDIETAVIAPMPSSGSPSQAGQAAVSEIKNESVPPANIAEPETATGSKIAEPILQDPQDSIAEPTVADEQVRTALEEPAQASAMPIETPVEAVVNDIGPAEMVTSIPAVLPDSIEDSSTGEVVSPGTDDMCEAIVPASSLLNLTNLISSVHETSRPAPQSSVVEPPPTANPVEAPLAADGEPERKPGRIVRKRKLKAKSTTVAAVPPASDLGTTASRAA